MNANSNRWLCLVVILLSLSVLPGSTNGQQQVSDIPQKSFQGKASYDVLRVIDGDTFVADFDGSEITVRLIGVDTPETVHPQKAVEAYGKEASQFTKNLLAGESVFLEYEAGASKQDKYGRTLAYVYRAPDGLFVNLEIVRQGYGHAYTEYPFQHMDLFRSYEAKAREAGKGLWGPGQGASLPTGTQAADPSKAAATDATSRGDLEGEVYITRTGSKYHRAGCRYLAKSMIPISLKDAVDRGYGPCLVCSPPQAPAVQETQKQSTSPQASQDVTVYITRTGGKYHRGGCRYLSKSRIPISLKDAKQRGYGPCSVCSPPR